MSLKARNFSGNRRPPALVLPPKQEKLRFDVRPVAEPRFEAVAAGGVGEISIFSHIGDPGGVTAGGIKSALNQLAGLPLSIQINSPGGDFWEGLTIYNLLLAHPQQVTVQVLGIAASAASIIAMAADRIEMARNSQMMIHKVWGLVAGNEDDFLEAAAMFKKFDAQASGTYAARTGHSTADIIAMMKSETFMDADEAIELKFADALLDADAQPAPQQRGAAPRSMRELEASLRTHQGLSRTAAAKAACAAWNALGGAPDAADLRSFTDRINSASTELERKLSR